ncbi:hypothetical protein FPV67DRAFT_307199 [Lyophyllum atratum]|nr:hypothetical protein FPV67DRAFT_307199 [Lyophyllum atratum]
MRPMVKARRTCARVLLWATLMNIRFLRSPLCACPEASRAAFDQDRRWCYPLPDSGFHCSCLPVALCPRSELWTVSESMP